MNFELSDQSIQYTFLNEKYTGGAKSRILNNVKEGVTAAGLADVGAALSTLQGDTLGAAILIQKQIVPLAD
ncbi:DUF1659 domain-containing protein [Lactobacillus sp. ESL0731]|uniref:DUF1659 domain-containing protein n=1 Tax=unclassified Lactobacillus TaxID=2620435 RepID=UPI0023F83066|nr:MULTISPECIES: DUF1659 domain-containing protein [unclassified Lactobacillus]WEV50973.1 DUF1659 domain-containing protein [Lactobacillus sp. ESL0700]WEV62104.1 DUF1659 domain-containing protein [Lactobacillus sp. ESL0731]